VTAMTLRQRLLLEAEPEAIAAELQWLGKAGPVAEALRGAAPAATPSSRWAESGQPDPHGDRYACERAALAHGDMSDDEMANAVFLDPHIGHLTGAKDRIRWLSRKLAEAIAAADMSAPTGWSLEETPWEGDDLRIRAPDGGTMVLAGGPPRLGQSIAEILLRQLALAAMPETRIVYRSAIAELGTRQPQIEKAEGLSARIADWQSRQTSPTPADPERP
jgi:hypothetical protein